MFWLRNKKDNFQLRTLIWGPDILRVVLSNTLILISLLYTIDLTGPGQTNTAHIIKFAISDQIYPALVCEQKNYMQVCVSVQFVQHLCSWRTVAAHLYFNMFKNLASLCSCSVFNMFSRNTFEIRRARDF